MLKSLALLVATVVMYSASLSADSRQTQTDTQSNKSFAADTRSRADRGDAVAQYTLGLMYDLGDGIPRDEAQAVAWYLKAAEQGHPKAQVNLGLAFGRGRGVPQDYDQAVRWYRKAAEQDDALAQFNMGLHYAAGQGVPQDDTEAMTWYRRAAEHGHIPAQFRLGMLYSKQRNYEQAILWWQKAAGQGHPDAEFALGVSYFDGQGVSQDYTRAAGWFFLAAEQGLAEAQFNLAVMYSNGWGVPKDDTQATKWYRRAAEQGHARAQAKVSATLSNPSMKKEASAPRTLSWAAGTPHSREFLFEGHKVRVIRTEAFSVLAYIESTDDPFRIRMHFHNTSDQAFDVIPETFTLAVLEPQPKALAFISAEQIEKNIENEAAWLMVAEAISSVGRAIGGTSTTSTSGTVTAKSPTGGSAYGTYNGLTTTYDSAANQRLTGDNLARIADIAESQKLRQLTGALLPNTVFAGEEFGGAVHFKREKRAVLLLLRVPVADRIVEIPIEVPKK